MRRFTFAWLVFWLVQQAALPVVAMAQEDPINPQFQQEVQGMSTETGAAGGPITPEAAASAASQATLPSSVGNAAPGTPLSSSSTDAPMYEDTESKSPLDTKVTLRVKNAPLSSFLDLISAQARVNFIIAEGLHDKQVTAFLRQVTVREALQILLQIKGLTYQRIGKSNSYVITPRSVSAPNVITRVFQLSYIPLTSMGNLQSDESSIGSQDVSVTGVIGDMEKSASAKATTGSDGGVSIVNVLQSVLSKVGKVSVEPRTNSLIITDIPEIFPHVEALLAELDKKSPQVLIEAQIVEISSEKANELGIEWGGSNGELVKFTGGSRASTLGLTDVPWKGSAWNSFYSDYVGATDGTIYKSVTTAGTFDLTSLTMLLKAVISKTQGRYLGKPKIVTLNNKPAIIKISRDTAVSVSAVTTGTTNTTSAQVERRTVGLRLAVTPQVNKDNYITLSVQPSYSDVTESSISTTDVPVMDPISRGASTLVRVKNGQTVVLGGLLSSTDKKVVRKVPLLGYIPIIGWLFTSVSKSTSNTDLVIFVTPTILVD